MAPASPQIINGAVKILLGFIFFGETNKSAILLQAYHHPTIHLNIGILPAEKTEYAFVMWELLVLFPRK